MGKTQTMPTLDAPSSTGTPLPASLRHALETSLHCDLSAVRIHEGHEATHLNATAFVRGTDIYFAPGQMPPPLLGHELTHVVQQASGRQIAPPLAQGLVEDQGLEREADATGQRVLTRD